MTAHLVQEGGHTEFFLGKRKGCFKWISIKALSEEDIVLRQVFFRNEIKEAAEKKIPFVIQKREHFVLCPCNSPVMLVFYQSNFWMAAFASSSSQDFKTKNVK